MKNIKHGLLLLVAVVTLSCAAMKESLSSAKNTTLLDRKDWKIDTLRKDVIWYHYTSETDPEFSGQNVNVISFDPKAELGHAVLAYEKDKDSLSAFASKIPGAIAGTNATYFIEKKDSADYMHLRLKGRDLQQVKVPKSSIYWWKHQGMMTFNNEGTQFDIQFSPEDFATVKSENIITGAPMLIANYKPVGLTFADTSGLKLELKKLHYEHYLKHQGVRHPRTAIAVTEAGKLLLIAVDGRNVAAKGMSAKELTRFLVRYFNPKSAMNIDGGGSTMMWIRGQEPNGIVNYPTDNKKFDHYGQRKVETALFIK